MIQEEERAHGTISAKTYLMFFKEGVKNHFATALIIVFFLLVEVSAKYICVPSIFTYICRVALFVEIGG